MEHSNPLSPAAAPTRSALLRVQERVHRDDEWTDDIRDRFFDALADTCNVTLACKEVEMSRRGAYKLRGRDAGFRERWRRAVGEGYAKLELKMIERALIGEACVRGALEGSEQDERALELLRRFPDAVTGLLYRAYRASAQQEEAELDEEGGDAAALAEIEAKLAALRRARA